MANNGFKVKNKISLKQSTTAGDTPGDIRYDGSGNLQLRDGAGEKTILDQDNSVTVSNKTLSSNTIDADLNTISNIGDEELKAGIDAAKLADGSVSNTEFQYLNGVTSAIQTQLDTKATTTALNDHINDTADAHAASAITNTPAGNLAATTVQAALDELQTDVDTRATSAALTSHTGASSGVHGVTGSVVGTTDTQTLTNKTLTAPVIDVASLTEQGSTPSTPSAGTKKFYAKNDGKLYTLDSGGNEIEVGSGSGGGGVLYINEDFETGVSNASGYEDAAGTSPVDGTGGYTAAVVTEIDNLATVDTYTSGMIDGADTNAWRGQEVIATASGTIYGVELGIFIDTGSGTPDGVLTIELRDNNSGNPGSTVHASTTVNFTDLPTSNDSSCFTYYPFSSGYAVTDTTSYWIVLRVSSADTAGYDVGLARDATAPTYSGDYAFSTNGGSTWTSGITSADVVFKVEQASTTGSLIYTAAETTSPLIGTTSLNVHKLGTDAQGAGVAIVSDTVDSAYSDKVHTVEFLWKTDANYADGDMSLWVVHPTTGTVEALYFRDSTGTYTNELPASSSSTLRVVSELTPVDSTYRIVLHVASTATAIYDVYVDNIQCGPQKLIPGTIVTEWESYTPAGAWSSYGTYTGKYRRVGDTLEVEASWTYSSAISGNFDIAIPSGLTIDTTKVTQPNTNTEGSILGIAKAFEGGVGAHVGSVIYTSTSTVRVLGDDGTSLWTATNPFTFGTGDALNVKFSVPISGWDAGAVLSTTQVDVQTAKLHATTSSSQALTADVTNIDFPTEELDTHNAWDGDTFTAPTTATYIITGMIRTGTSSQKTVRAYINGTADKVLNSNGGTSVLCKFSGSIYLQKGDTLSFRCDASETIAAGIPANNWLTIDAQPDFSTFAVAQPSTSRKAVTSKTTTYTATIADEYILADTSGGAWTLTLPTAVGNTGKEFVIKYTDSGFANALTVDGNGSETIDGSTTTTLNTQGETLKIVSDGSNWQIVERRIPSEWQAYTPAFTGFGTASGVDCEWRRSGDSIELLLRFSAGTSTAVAAEVDLPSGLTIDSSFTSNSCVVGAWHKNDSSANSRKRGVLWLNASYTNSVLFGNDDYTTSGTPFSTLTGTAVGSSVLITGTAKIKITGWNP